MIYADVAITKIEPKFEGAKHKTELKFAFYGFEADEIIWSERIAIHNNNISKTRGLVVPDIMRFFANNNWKRSGPWSFYRENAKL